MDSTGRPDGPALDAPARTPIPTELLLVGLAFVLVIVAAIGVAFTTSTTGATIEKRFLIVNGKSVPVPPSTLAPVEVASGTVPFRFAPGAAGTGSTADDVLSSVVGRWGKADGEAAILSPAGPRNIAVVHLAHPPKAVQVTLPQIVGDAGLVMDYQDPAHYLMLVPIIPGNSLWLAWVNGDPARPYLLLDVAITLPPKTVLEAVLTPSDIIVIVNGKVVGTVPHPSPPAVLSTIGLVASGSGSSPAARFTDLVVSS